MLMQPITSPLPVLNKDIFLLRHGETDWNVEGRIQGHTDIHLNATGRAQAEAAARYIASHMSITMIVTSPLLRARHTAHNISDLLGLPIYIERNLKERSFGRFEGRLRSEILAEQNLEHHQMSELVYPPDAETWPALKERVRTTLAKWHANHPAERILFVTHGAFTRALYEELEMPCAEVHNAKPYHFAPSPTGWCVND